MFDFTTMTDIELEDARVAILTEQERRQLVASAHTLADDLARRYEAAVTGQPPIPAADMAHNEAVGPGGKLDVDGVIWRNKSGAWLSPHTAGPAAYPLGWEQLTGLPTDVTPWAPGQNVTTGSLRTFDGRTWRCVQAHTTQTGWEPPAVPALWTLA